MIKIGLTGGIGSGKSTVATLFAKLGITVIDTDEIAHALTQPGMPAFKRIVDHFGETALLPNGSLNRSLIKNAVFNDDRERLWLERTLHPKIIQKMQQAMASATGTYCIAVVPLLIEKNMQSLFDRILVVDVSEETQRQRIIQRETTPPTLIEKILKTQCNRHERLKYATDTISNEGDKDALEHHVKSLHQHYLRLT